MKGVTNVRRQFLFLNSRTIIGFVNSSGKFSDCASTGFTDVTTKVVCKVKQIKFLNLFLFVIFNIADVKFTGNSQCILNFALLQLILFYSPKLENCVGIKQIIYLEGFIILACAVSHFVKVFKILCKIGLFSKLLS